MRCWQLEDLSRGLKCEHVDKGDACVSGVARWATLTVRLKVHRLLVHIPTNCCEGRQ